MAFHRCEDMIEHHLIVSGAGICHLSSWWVWRNYLNLYYV